MSDSSLTAAERAVRSIFVRNIPPEVTEEKLKELLFRMGTILNFKLLTDSKVGKNKGSAFCEYTTQDAARIAILNLNGYELHGRVLQVENALSEKSKEEMKNFLSSEKAVEGASQAEPEKSSENISKAVASLPAEQMFELMKQIKMCIQNNPNEARLLLLQNPQLSYALLQAAIVMRIVDPNIAVSILNRPNPSGFDTSATEAEASKKTSSSTANTISSSLQNASASSTLPMNLRSLNDIDLRQPFPLVDRSVRMPPPSVFRDQDMRQFPGDQDMRQLPPTQSFDPRFPVTLPIIESNLSTSPNDPRTLPIAPRGAAIDPRSISLNPRAIPLDPRAAPFDPRSTPLDPRAKPFEPRTKPFEPRTLPMDPKAAAMDPRTATMDPRAAAMDPRAAAMDPRAAAMDPRAAAMDPRAAAMDPRAAAMDPRAAAIDPRAAAIDPRVIVTDPRTAYDRRSRLSDIKNAQQILKLGRPPVPSTAIPPPTIPPPVPSAMSATRPQLSLPTVTSSLNPTPPQDQDKAALIMQVLQLTDQQIAMLPPDQRQSILFLKEQIARGLH